MHGLLVLPADGQDRDGARRLLEPLVGRLPRLEKRWADAGYAGRLVEWAREAAGWAVEIVAKPSGATTFVVVPKRWIVERPFAWLGTCRRLAKDYEHSVASSEALIRFAMIGLMLRRLRPAPCLRTHFLSVSMSKSGQG